MTRSTERASAPSAIAESAPVAANDPVDTLATTAAPADQTVAPAGDNLSAPPVTIAQDTPPISDTSTEALWFGLLAALGIGGAGFAFARSRRRRHVEPAVIERPVVVDASVPVSEPAQARQPVAPAYATPTAPVAAGAVPLPRELPENFAERDRLLREMIAAKPDKANPFQSPKARARRARLILQSLGQDFRNRKPRFDLSQYANVWPALRGWQPATA